MLDSPPSGGKITAVPQFSSIARPYAEAVFALAQEANDFDRWSAFLARAAVVAADAQVVRLIQDPRVAQETLFGIVADLSVKGEGEAQRNFLRLLIANRRARALPDIAAQFEKLRAEAEGTVDAELVTAFAVSDAQKEKIAAALGRKLGRKVRLNVSEDGDLIGGAIVRAGDMVIDASVRGQLEQLKNALRA
ncbi:MAG: F0F1 ATP synthase subunit delta [Gammaproteobacteria bacterium]|nr:F0F1 ATP synthase subunit delta [Gammaproteobacteria bacterium]